MGGRKKEFMEIEGIKTYIWVGNSEVKETVMASGGADVASGLSSGVDQTLDGRPVPGL